MPDLRAVQPLVDQETGLAVVSTTLADGTVQATVVNAGILTHPISGEQVVGFVTRGGTRKHHHLRARPSCTVTFRRGWRWATIEGDAEYDRVMVAERRLAVLVSPRRVYTSHAG